MSRDPRARRLAIAGAGFVAGLGLQSVWTVPAVHPDRWWPSASAQVARPSAAPAPATAPKTPTPDPAAASAAPAAASAAASAAPTAGPTDAPAAPTAGPTDAAATPTPQTDTTAPAPSAPPTPTGPRAAIGPELPLPARSPDAAGTGAWNLIGLGDSVLTHCRCAGVLRDYADLVAGPAGRPVQVHNAATSGATSSDVLRTLDRDRKLGSELAHADAVVIFVGANDFNDAFDAVSGGASTARFAAAGERLRRNLTGILNRVRERTGDRVPVLVCGYWNDFKDGQVAQRKYSGARRRAAAAATDATNDAIQQAAVATGARYVSTTTAFAERTDRTDLLDPDGDHLSAAGSQLIAAALLQAAQVPAVPDRGASRSERTQRI